MAAVAKKKKTTQWTVTQLQGIHHATLRTMVKGNPNVAPKDKMDLTKKTKNELMLLLTGDPELKKTVAAARRKATREANLAARA